MKTHYNTIKNYEDNFMTLVEEVVHAGEPLIRVGNSTSAKQYFDDIYKIIRDPFDKYFVKLVKLNPDYELELRESKDVIQANFSIFQANLSHFLMKVDE